MRDAQLTSYPRANRERDAQLTTYPRADRERDAQLTSCPRPDCELDAQLTSYPRADRERDAQLTTYPGANRVRDVSTINRLFYVALRLPSYSRDVNFCSDTDQAGGREWKAHSGEYWQAPRRGSSAVDVFQRS